LASQNPPWNFLDAGVLARLSKLALHSRLPMQGFVSGMHRSAARGSSVEFAEYRKYSHGDDPRFLDWRIFAKTDRFYIREFEADTNLRCHLVIDTSGSMRFGTETVQRIDRAKSIAATLAHVLINQGDAVGLCSIGQSAPSDIPPRRATKHLQIIYHQLANLKAANGNSLVSGLHQLAERISQRSLVIIISDFFDEVPLLLECFKHLRFKKHDVALFHLLDQKELTFDFESPVNLIDTETGTSLATDPMLLRDAYLQSLNTYLHELRSGCAKFRIDYRIHRLHEDYETLLSDFFISRLRRRRNRRG
jgi:uncharacterized protein (DUF58 family)